MLCPLSLAGCSPEWEVAWDPAWECAWEWEELRGGMLAPELRMSLWLPLCTLCACLGSSSGRAASSQPEMGGGGTCICTAPWAATVMLVCPTCQ